MASVVLVENERKEFRARREKSFGVINQGKKDDKKDTRRAWRPISGKQRLGKGAKLEGEGGASEAAPMKNKAARMLENGSSITPRGERAPRAAPRGVWSISKQNAEGRNRHRAPSEKKQQAAGSERRRSKRRNILRGVSLKKTCEGNYPEKKPARN